MSSNRFPILGAHIAAFTIACVLSILTATTAQAQPIGDDAQDARDQAAVAAVVLDMDGAQRVAAVSRDALAAIKQSCLIRGHGNDQSLDSCVAEVAAQPQIAAALASHGLSARRYALLMSALMQGDLGAQTTAKGNAEGIAMLAAMGINPAHTRFVTVHRAEIDKLFNGLKFN